MLRGVTINNDPKYLTLFLKLVLYYYFWNYFIFRIIGHNIQFTFPFIRFETSNVGFLNLFSNRSFQVLFCDFTFDVTIYLQCFFIVKCFKDDCK